MQKLKTRVVKKNTNPEWNDELTLSIADPGLPVQVVRTQLQAPPDLTHEYDRNRKLKPNGIVTTETEMVSLGDSVPARFHYFPPKYTSS